MFEMKTMKCNEQYMQYEMVKPLFSGEISQILTFQKSKCKNYQILAIGFMLFKYEIYLYNVCRDIRNGCQSLFITICKFLLPKYHALSVLSECRA